MKLIGLLNRLNITYWAIRVLRRLLRALPLTVAYALAAALADAVFALWPAIRRRTVANFRHVVPDRCADAVAAASFRHYFRYLVEFLRADDLEGRAEVRGVEHIHQAMSVGRGAVAVGFHIGNIDLGAALLARVGYPVDVVVDTFQPPRLDALIQRQREANGLTLIPLGLAPRRALRVLRRKEILALLMDKPLPDDQGVVVDFFDGRISIPAGAAYLSLRTGAPIVPCCVVRLPGGRFLAEVGAPVPPQGDAVAVTQAVVRVLEGWIRRHPEQWYPFRRMFV